MKRVRPDLYKYILRVIVVFVKKRNRRKCKTEKISVNN